MSQSQAQLAESSLHDADGAAASLSSPPVWSCNEWDPLEEIIVGVARNARFPHPDKSSQNTEFTGTPLEQMPHGPFPDWVLEETEEDLQALSAALEKQGVKVRRPQVWAHDRIVSTASWQAKGFYNYCPRDVFLVIGDRIIESPNAMRGRYHESFGYRDILLEYLDGGARWFSAPKPMLEDDVFDVPVARPVPKNVEPIFDAANVLRLGDDLLYLLSSTGNERGAQWLRSVLPSRYTVHVIEINYYGSHVDTSLVALRPGLLLCNPERVRVEMLPAFLREWEIIFSPELIEPYERSAEYQRMCLGSKWMGMNLLSLGPDLVVVDEHQPALIELLDRHGVRAIPLELRHARMLGGGFHCVTLDVRRRTPMMSGQ